MAARKSIASGQRAYEDLRARIIRLDLPPGYSISENEIARDLGVSRTPVREALMLLRDEGLVEVLPKVGTFVTRVDLRRVQEAQFLREAVEVASLRTLSLPFDEEIIESLYQNLDEQAEVGEDIDLFFQLDEGFHKGLMALADHKATWATVAAAKGHLDRARRLGIDRHPTRELVAQHRAILDSVCAGVLQRAEESLRHHLRGVFEDIRRIEREAPHLFVTDSDAQPVRRSVIVWQ